MNEVQDLEQLGGVSFKLRLSRRDARSGGESHRLESSFPFSNVGNHRTNIGRYDEFSQSRVSSDVHLGTARAFALGTRSGLCFTQSLHGQIIQQGNYLDRARPITGV